MTIPSKFSQLPGFQDATHLRLQCPKGHVHIRIQIVLIQPLQCFVHPVLAVPCPPVTHHRHERNVIEQILHPVRGDIPDDVGAPPVARLVERDVEAVLCHVGIGVADDFVTVAPLGGGADDDGPVQGVGATPGVLTAPELGDFDGVVAGGDLHRIEHFLQRIFYD